MKLITFAVPSYNSQDYLHKCIKSLVIAGPEVEVIIINDGSTDKTEEIARKYEKLYPHIIRVISKENAGHGSGVNEGIKNATGLYFKVVDSDDWLDKDALFTLLQTIRKHQKEGKSVDLYITNFIYDKVSENKSFVRSFKKHFKVDKHMSWKDVKRFHGSEVLLMHSLMFKTDKLRESNIDLPHHTFYVDNLYAYKPLPLMETIYYMDINLYHYYIGREDQSVNIVNFIKRYDQQIRVMKRMISAYSTVDIKNMQKGLRNYMFHCLGAIMIITILFTVAEDGKERRKALKDLWQYIKNTDKNLYWRLRLMSLPTIVNYIPFRLRGYIMVFGYRVLRKS